MDSNRTGLLKEVFEELRSIMLNVDILPLL